MEGNYSSRVYAIYNGNGPERPAYEDRGRVPHALVDGKWKPIYDHKYHHLSHEVDFHRFFQEVKKRGGSLPK